MPVDQFHKLLMQVAKASNHNGMSERDGYVHEVKGDKMRAVIGIKPDGSPMLSPWTSTSDHRGGSRERNQYVKGQNVRLSAPGGDYRQATLSPGAHGKSFPAPAHADQINGDSYQSGKIRKSTNRVGGDQGGEASGNQPDGQQSGGQQSGDQQKDQKHFDESWIADQDDNAPAHQDQSGKPENGSSSGKDGSSSDGSGQQQSDAKPIMKQRMHEEGGLTGRVGKDADSTARYAAHEKGAKLKFGKDATTWADKEGTWMRFGDDNVLWVDKEGIWSSKPIQVKDMKKKDPIPDDDK
jgi:hypothetical protein